jgi:type I restriction enzyme S subunit
MKKGWQTKKLGDLCEIELGKTPARANKLFWDEKQETSNVWLSIADLLKVEDKIVVNSKEYLSDEGAAISKIVRKGTLLVSFKLTLGRLAFAGRDLFTNEAIAALTIFNERELSKEYLFYFLHFFNWRKAAENDVKLKGMTLNKAKLRELQVYFPLPPEQKRIVSILDEAFEGISAAVANAEKNLANARELFDGYLNSVFSQKGEGWVENQLSDICDITSKLVDPREPDFIDLPHLGAGNMISMTGELVDIKTAREEGLKSGKFLFDDTMVLYSKIRPYLMKACRPDFSGLCSADVYPLSPLGKHLDRNFLFHMLMSRQFTDYAIAGSDRAGMPKVNRDHLFRYSVCLPTIDEQTRLASKLDAISAESGRLEAIYQQKLAALAALKQSILQKAFAGELTAQPEQFLQEAVA